MKAKGKTQFEIDRLKKELKKYRDLTRESMREALNLRREIQKNISQQIKYEKFLELEVMLPTAEGIKYFNNAKDLDSYIEDLLWDSMGFSYTSNLASRYFSYYYASYENVSLYDISYKE